MNEFVNENKLIASVLLVAAALVMRWLVVRFLRRRSSEDDELPKRWINSVTNATTLLIGIGLIAIWLSELRYVALSVAAFIVAIVIATREFIQCFVGSLYLASTRTFTVGDWIKVGDHYGEVVRSDWLSTTMLEIDMESMSYAYTGRSLVVPNNQFVASTVQNLNFMRRYIMHSFAIVRDAETVNVYEASAFILEKAKEYCRSFKDVAERYNGLIEKRLGVSLSGPEASVRVTTNNLGKNVFTVTLFCPTQEAVAIEQKIIRDFMAYWYEALLQTKLKLEGVKVPVHNTKAEVAQTQTDGNG